MNGILRSFSFLKYFCHIHDWQTKPNNSLQDNADPEKVLRLPSVLENDSALTQRRLAKELGIALGLANAYLRRCIKKGLTKAKHVLANRYKYFLTSSGFSEKSRLTKAYRSQSFLFFARQKRNTRRSWLREGQKINMRSQFSGWLIQRKLFWFALAVCSLK